MKVVKKTVKPAFTVDLTKCETGFDVLCKFAETKHNAGLPITDAELEALIEKATSEITKQVLCTAIVDVYEVKKMPWYKRFWRWITRKNKKD